jgi:hypothetical protein
MGTLEHKAVVGNYVFIILLFAYVCGPKMIHLLIYIYVTPPIYGSLWRNILTYASIHHQIPYF